MAQSGYSHRSLSDKLGVKPGMRLVRIHAPTDYARMLRLGSMKVKMYTRLVANADLVHVFVDNSKTLHALLPKLKQSIAKNGAIWISWPKQSSRKATDLNGNTVRTIGLLSGLVDIKVVAVNDDWSGLKFVYRRKDRN